MPSHAATNLARGVRPFHGIVVDVLEGDGTEAYPLRIVEYRYERTDLGYRLLERSDPSDRDGRFLDTHMPGLA